MAKKSSSTVTVGCRLPCGIVLEHPTDPKIKVTLKGRFTNVGKGNFIDGGYSSNEVDAEFWNAWLLRNSEYAPYKKGAIFAVNDDASAEAVAKELADEKTGFEPMQTDGKDPRASGVVSDDKK